MKRSPPRGPQAPDLLPLARQDLAVYATALYRSFILARHIELMCSKLEALERGEILRLLVAEPPRHGKTLLLRLFVSWLLGRRPTRSVIFSSYSQELAEDSGRAVRNMVSDPKHEAIFGREACLSEDSAAVHRFTTRAGGLFYAVGRGGSITGRGADIFVADDLLKDREEANSATIRRQLQEWYASVAHPRLEPGGAVVVVSTRWHLDDLTGWLLREHADEGWTVLSLPAIAEPGDELGRLEGEALWPERYPVEELQRIKSVVGSANWSSLYQQRPVSSESAVFKPEWWQTYRERPAEFDRIVMSADTAFKVSQVSDFSVVTTWGQTKTGFYLLNVWRERCEFPRLKAALTALAAEWRPNALLVEDRASGQSLIQELRSETSLPVLPVRIDSDKVTRAQAVTPMIEAGRVFIPAEAPWLADFLGELGSFPAAPHDDQVDSVTQALNYLRGQHDGVLDYIEREVEQMRRDGRLPPEPEATP